jgi:Tfp pilus assembly protein PilX
MRFSQQRGAALFLTMVIMSGIFAIGIAVMSLLIGEVRTSRDIGHYIPAIYAADTGIERALYQIRINGTFPAGTCQNAGDCVIGSSASPKTLNTNAAEYFVSIYDTGFGNCTAATQCIVSNGRLGGTARALTATY